MENSRKLCLKDIVTFWNEVKKKFNYPRVMNGSIEDTTGWCVITTIFNIYKITRVLFYVIIPVCS